MKHRKRNRYYHTRKYTQEVPRTKVLKMMKRGWCVQQVTIDPPKRQVFDGDLYDIPALQPKIGYVLVDPDGYIVSETPKRYASQAWDDILGG